MKLPFRHIAIPLCAGILLGLAFPSTHIHALAWIGLVPLLWDVRDAKPARAAQRFFLAGFVFHLIVLHWLASNVMWAGGWALIGYAGLCLYMSAYWAALGAVWSWMRPRAPIFVASIAFAALWVVMEGLQDRLFTGFGWSALAYSQGGNPYVLQLAALGSAALITFVVVFFNALLARALSESKGRVPRIAAAILLAAAAHGVGYLLIAEAEFDADPLTVGILQSDFPQEMKWDTEYTVDMVENASLKSIWMAKHWDTDLVVWPESLVMTDPQDDYELQRLISDAARESQCTYFIGSVRRSANNFEGYNSSFLVSPNGSFDSNYDKIHLAPFGEYVPLAEYLPFVEKVVPAIGDVDPGSEVKVFEVDGRSFGPLICFEVLFSPMAEKLRKDGADFLVVITNLGWFGNSAAVTQEFEIARMRAVETRLPLVHSANTGISGVFDPFGRFTVVDSWQARNGQMYTATQELTPSDVITERMFGAFPISKPAPRPAPFSPSVFLLIAAGIALIAIVWCGFRGNKIQTGNGS